MPPRIRLRPVAGLNVRWKNLLLGIRTLALLMRSPGAKLRANDHRHRDTPGHFQPFSLRSNGTSGHTDGSSRMLPKLRVLRPGIRRPYGYGDAPRR
jgi:hypothetical protein